MFATARVIASVPPTRLIINPIPSHRPVEKCFVWIPIKTLGINTHTSDRIQNQGIETGITRNMILYFDAKSLNKISPNPILRISLIFAKEKSTTKNSFTPSFRWFYKLGKYRKYERIKYNTNIDWGISGHIFETTTLWHGKWHKKKPKTFHEKIHIYSFVPEKHPIIVAYRTFKKI